MGLQSLVQGLVNTAFSALGDLAQEVQYLHKGSRPAYDTTTGKVLPSVREALEVVRAVISTRTNSKGSGYEDTSSKEAPGRLKALIPSVDLKVGPPATNDRIIRNNETFVVQGVDIDAAQACWVLDIEREGGSVQQ